MVVSHEYPDVGGATPKGEFEMRRLPFRLLVVLLFALLAALLFVAPSMACPLPAQQFVQPACASVQYQQFQQVQQVAVPMYQQVIQQPIQLQAQVQYQVQQYAAPVYSQAFAVQQYAQPVVVAAVGVGKVHLGLAGRRAARQVRRANATAAAITAAQLGY